MRSMFVTEHEKLKAALKGVQATIVAIVDALATGNPGLSVVLEERMKAQIRDLAETEDEESFYATMLQQMVLRKLQASGRSPRPNS